MSKKLHEYIQVFLILLMVLLVSSGCSTATKWSEKRNKIPPLEIPKPLMVRDMVQDLPDGTMDSIGRSVAHYGEYEVSGADSDSSTRYIVTPQLSKPKRVIRDKNNENEVVDVESVVVNFDSLPLSAFINEVYGTVLGESFEIDSKLRKKKDLVTLRSKELVSENQLRKMSNRVLANYGVDSVSQGDVRRFFFSKKISSGLDEPPLLLSGRTLPNVPGSHRTVFQLVPLHVVTNTSVATWLKLAFKTQNLVVHSDPARNAILLQGDSAIIKEALAAIDMLDQPAFKGHHSIGIELEFQDPETLAKRLATILKSEGYGVSLIPEYGSIFLLPIDEVQTVLAFAADEAVLHHVLEWIELLDKPTEPKLDQGETGIFFYQAKYTNAADMRDSLLSLQAGGLPPMAVERKGNSTEKSAATRVTAKTLVTPSNINLVLDKTRNALIFSGKADVWQQLESVLVEMDKPARMVLLEVTIAEVTLDENQEFGIEWLFDDVDGFWELGTKGGFSLGSSGLSFIYENAGATYAALNAFKKNKRVSILSTPRIMVKSGHQATIDVGTEVPIISRTESTADSTTGTVTEIQYRKTGVLLNVTPVVHSGRTLELDVTQEVSETITDETNLTASPSIFTRKIETSVSLEDGGSVLLGGLITRNRTADTEGIPFLSDIPLLGYLFGVEGDRDSRTDLIMLIIPYIIDNAKEAEAVTKAFRERVDL